MSDAQAVALAKIGWVAYCYQADGKTFDGKPLPTWEELGDERQLCWIEAAQAMYAEVDAWFNE